MFEVALQVIQVGSGVLVVLAILLQRSGAGAGQEFGGSGGDEGFTHRRGGERVIFIATFVLAFVFIASILAPIVLPL